MSVASAVSSPKMRKLVLNHQKEYVLINVGPRTVSIQYGGETVWVPPGARGHSKVERDDSTRPRKLVSYKNPANGKYVPGTLVIKDIVKVNPVFGSREVIWDAAEFIMERIGENCERDYGRRGISWAPVDASMEDLAKSMEEAFPRWYQSEIRDAKTVLAEESERLRVSQMRNMPATPPSDDVVRAREILRIEAERSQKTVQDLMKGFRIDAEGYFAPAPTMDAGPSTGDDIDSPLFDADPVMPGEKGAQS